MNSFKIKIIDHRHKPVPYWLAVLRSMVFVAVLFGPGLLADSAAMQWAGFVLFIGCVIGNLLASAAEDLTIAEARERLDELDAKLTP